VQRISRGGWHWKVRKVKMFKLSEESLEKEEKRRITEVCSEMIEIELRALEEEKKKGREELRGLKERIKEHEERIKVK